MHTFVIPPLSRNLEAELRHRIDDKTKPLGSLGKLESVALRLGLIQGRVDPELKCPVVLVFAADHGLAREGASPYPPEVTRQMVLNYLQGGAAVNAFVRQHGMRMRIVDAGVDGELPEHPDLISLKVRRGSRNSLREAALTLDEVDDCLIRGASVSGTEIERGADAVLCGEMGIGNTSASALILSALLQLPLDECIGRGAGHDDKGLERKRQLLHQVREARGAVKRGREALAAYGGLEIAMMSGAMIAAASQRRLILVDGFIATAAAVAAENIRPGVLDYCLFSHASAESGHARALRELGVEPLVDLGLRLGEATGAVLVWPLLQSATGFLREMATFSSAGVTEGSASRP
jgi:nicotinate-nucleotide--dimethylbenzimidazole phosphoribosyltransferase